MIAELFSRLYKSDLELGFYENNILAGDRILKVTYVEKKQRKFRSHKYECINLKSFFKIAIKG